MHFIHFYSIHIDFIFNNLFLQNEANSSDDPIMIVSSDSSESNEGAKMLPKKKKVRGVRTKCVQNEFTVESILKNKKIGGAVIYKVKWLGYPKSKCTWEPLKNFNDFSLLEEYFLSKIE